MKIPVILQARTGSTRLPGKVLMDLAGKPLLARVIEALMEAGSVSRVVIATDTASAEAIAPLAAGYGCRLFVGSGEDVLGRFAGALEGETAVHCIRATGDNPLVCFELLDRAVSYHFETGSDLTHFLGIPWGCGVEVVRTAALQEAAREADDPYEREHVTPYLYRHPERFRIMEPELNMGGDLRLTVDTIDDFRVVERLFLRLYKGKPLPLREILGALEQLPGLYSGSPDDPGDD